MPGSFQSSQHGRGNNHSDREETGESVMSTTLSDIRESFWHAAMAKAAYAAITDDGTLRQALNDDGFSPALLRIT